MAAKARVPLSLSLAPFLAAAALTWVAVLVDESIDWRLYALAVALLALSWLILAARARAPWGARRAGTVSALVFLAALGLLRASAGGINSGASAIALIPVFYTAMYGQGRTQLYIVLGALAAFYLAPIVLVGPPAYPTSQYRAALLVVSVSALIGVATRRLVADVRHQASEALAREQMVVQVHEVVRGLYTSTHVRQDVCEAARTIGQASMAILFEPLPGASAMRSTALAGVDAPAAEISTMERNAVTEAFASGRPQLIVQDVAAHVASRALWQAAGCPESVLYEPLMRGPEPVGVLVVGWPARVRASGTRATVVALLAHEAAGVIDRADTLSQLTDMASTDPLTGLPNRRAWDARVSHALKAGQRFTVAMLDFDRFKEFNDTHGHPAGDRLLKETAACWREQLRAGDMLARLGGEEFGLLLLDCNTARAVDVIERLRVLVSEDRTCSAGFAEHRPGESAEAVLARADAALYDAKAAGRDRLCMSGG
jgi:diguanylate cyclase (GGDEF)-like protein